jgi:hypothetical protein
MSQDTIHLQPDRIPALLGLQFQGRFAVKELTSKL